MKLSTRASSQLQIARDIRSRRVSAAEVTQQYLQRLHSVEHDVKSFLAVNEDAVRQAEAIDERIAKGEDVGLLAGVPVAVKVREGGHQRRNLACAGVHGENCGAKWVQVLFGIFPAY
jgi:hypothetical protein